MMKKVQTGVEGGWLRQVLGEVKTGVEGGEDRC